MKKFKPQPTEWKPRLLEYVQYREGINGEWLDAQVSQITAHTITVFVFKFRVAHQINKFTMKDFVRKHPKDLVLNDWKGVIGTYGAPETLGDMDSTRIEVRNTPAQSEMVQEVWNRIDHPSDIEQAQEMVPTGIVLAVVAFVGFILSALFWVVFQLVK